MQPILDEWLLPAILWQVLKQPSLLAGCPASLGADLSSAFHYMATPMYTPTSQLFAFMFQQFLENITPHKVLLLDTVLKK